MLLVLTAATAQTIDINKNAYRTGDMVTKQQIEYKDPGQKGEGLLWDISEQELVNDGYQVAYSDVAAKENVVAGAEHNTRYYYRQTTDSLLLTGYENHTTHVEYDLPEMVLHFPLTFGDKKQGLFHGSAVYSERNMMRVYGSWQMEVDATGSLILPTGDTLRHVTRVHSTKIMAQQQFPHIKTKQQLQWYINHVAPYCTDSISAHLSQDSALVEINTYKWYVEGYRYPIFETITTGPKGCLPQYMTAYYYPPREQEDLAYDKENEDLRRELAEADRRGGADGSNGHQGSNGNNGTDSIIDYHVTVTDNGQTATLSSSIIEFFFIISFILGNNGSFILSGSGAFLKLSLIIELFFGVAGLLFGGAGSFCGGRGIFFGGAFLNFFGNTPKKRFFSS